ncbi:MAG TPA: aminotransferase class IV [Anaerolineales bacterium]|nr:aminotransferase class IV [Anaerolineales bacterium]
MIFVYNLLENRLHFIEYVDNNFDNYTAELPTGLYTTFRTYDSGTKGIGINQHLGRLHLSEGEEVTLRESIRKIIKEIGENNQEWKLRIHKIQIEQSEWVILAEKFEKIDPNLRESGITVDLSGITRSTPSEKSTGYIKASFEKRMINKREGVYESLIVANNKVREGFTSNFYYIKNGIVNTAKNNILHGVTRSKILKLAQGEGIKICYRSLHLDELSQVEECFISSSSRGVLHIKEFRYNPIYRWGKGPITKLLAKKYEIYESESLELI